MTKDGRIVNEGTVRRNASQMEHKDRTKDLLADAIVRNALEIEVGAIQPSGLYFDNFSAEKA